MRSKQKLTTVTIFSLGAINGLLVGLALEQVRLKHLIGRMVEAQQNYLAHNNVVGSFYEPHQEFVIPLVCFFSFPIVGYLIHRYYRSRPNAVLLAWSILGGAAIWVGYFMATSNPDAFSLVWLLVIAIVSYFAHWLWKNHTQSVLLFWLVLGISAVVVLALGQEVLGVFYYWPELRSPFTWLVYLGIVLIISLVYGGLVQLLFRME